MDEAKKLLDQAKANSLNLKYKPTHDIPAMAEQIHSIFVDMNQLSTTVELLNILIQNQRVKDATLEYELLDKFTVRIEASNEKMIAPLKKDIEDIKIQNEKERKANAETQKLTNERLNALEQKDAQKALSLWTKIKSFVVDNLISTILGGLIALFFANGLFEFLKNIFMKR